MELKTFLISLLALALVATLGIVFAGIYVTYKGGDTSKKYSNRLMRMRVYAQGAAVIILALIMLMK